MEEVQLARRLHHRHTQMSGGEQQRVAIARSLINQPSRVLGAEPMGEVEADTATHLLELMRSINRERGVSVVIVTHDLELASRTDCIIRLGDGRLVSDTPTSDLPARVAPAPAA